MMSWCAESKIESKGRVFLRTAGFFTNVYFKVYVIFVLIKEVYKYLVGKIRI